MDKVEEEATPEPRGRPRGSRRGVAVKMDEDVAHQARVVALERGLSLAEYLSGIARGPVGRDYRKTVKQMAKGVEP